MPDVVYPAELIRHCRKPGPTLLYRKTTHFQNPPTLRYMSMPYVYYIIVYVCTLLLNCASQYQLHSYRQVYQVQSYRKHVAWKSTIKIKHSWNRPRTFWGELLKRAGYNLWMYIIHGLVKITQTCCCLKDCRWHQIYQSYYFSVIQNKHIYIYV